MKDIKLFVNGVELPESNIIWGEGGFIDSLTRKYGAPIERRYERVLESEIKTLRSENKRLREELEAHEKEVEAQTIAEIKLKLLNERDEFAMLRNYVCNLLSKQTDLNQRHKEMIRGAMTLRIDSINKQIKELEED